MKATQFSNNHIVLTDENSISLQSYDTIVVKKQDCQVYLDTKWNCSNTTAKNVYQFLFNYCRYDEMNKKSVTKLIENGTFIVKDLN